VLPDDVLLEILDFCVVGYPERNGMLYKSQYVKRGKVWWQSLVHVCRRWRSLVFASSRRLNLQLLCTNGTSARKTLDIWPVLLLLKHDLVMETSVDDVVAVLEQNKRIRQIDLSCILTSQKVNEKVWAAIQVPFPELTGLQLTSRSETTPFLPDSFLGGSAPRLRSLGLEGIPFLGLPNLLLSATHLVTLSLSRIPHSGYISPEAMVTCLSVLTVLEGLSLGFESPQSYPDQEIQRPPPPTRTILSALKEFWFKGAYEYLEDLVARLDAPRCHWFSISFFNDIVFDTPQFIQFISRAQIFKAPNNVHVVFDSHSAWVSLRSQASIDEVEVKVSCRVPDGQLSFLAQICTSSPLFSTTEILYINERYRLSSPLDWKDDIENAEWLDLFRPFTDVKDLYISEEFAPRIAPALQELTGGRTTDVLPTVQNIFLEPLGPDQEIEGIGQFISARQLTNSPVAISVWKRNPWVNYSADIPGAQSIPKSIGL